MVLYFLWGPLGKFLLPYLRVIHRMPICIQIPSNGPLFSLGSTGKISFALSSGNPSYANLYPNSISSLFFLNCGYALQTVSLSLVRSLYNDPAIPPSSCFLEIPANNPSSENDFDKAADRSSPLKLPHGYQIFFFSNQNILSHKYIIIYL